MPVLYSVLRKYLQINMEFRLTGHIPHVSQISCHQR